MNLPMNLIDLFRPRTAVKVSVTQEQQTRAIALQTTGMTHYKQGQYDAAASCLESALALWTVLGNFHAEQRLFQWLGSCYWNLGEVQAAHCCYEEALTLMQALGKRPCLCADRPSLGWSQSLSQKLSA